MSAILKRCTISLIADWLARAKQSELNHLHLSDEERAEHLPKLIQDLIVRLNKPEKATRENHAVASPAAIAHGELRQRQGYSSSMLVDESRILQVTLFGTLHKNVNALDFALLLPDVMIIADEVDSQLR